MDRVYILAGFLWLVTGVIFGIYLGITDQLQFANSHAHANLLGFVISTLFGLLFRNWPVLQSSRLWPGRSLRFSRLELWCSLRGSTTLTAAGGGAFRVVLQRIFYMGFGDGYNPGQQVR